MSVGLVSFIKEMNILKVMTNAESDVLYLAEENVRDCVVVCKKSL